MQTLLANPDFDDIMNFSMVPWGNARNVSGVIQCQHGADECTLNGIEACMIDAYPDAHDWFSALVCIDQSGPSSQKMIDSVENCMKSANLDYSKVSDCVSSGKVNQLVEKAGQATLNLDPPHIYVPWVTVNDMPVFELPLNDDADTSFPTLICFAARVNGWTTADLPDRCNKGPPTANAKKESVPAIEPCFDN